MKLSSVLGGAVAALVLFGGAADAGAKDTPAPASGKIVAMRRVTETQYRHAIADIFGAGIKIQGRFEPEVRRDGLIAVGSAGATISAGGMEQYYAMASDIAHQVVSSKSLACQPARADTADHACATIVLGKYGRLLYRRPLREGELGPLVQLADSVGVETKDFYAGVREALSGLLSSPNFLFRIERAGGAPDKGVAPLDGYSRATRMSYFFWNTTPDEELLQAAENGELSTKAGIARQVERLSGSPRMTDGVSGFFDDMLRLSLFETQSKDPQFFPKYGQILAAQAREQTVRTVVDLLVTRNEDYRDIFTSRDTFMTRMLAMVYKVPYTSRADWSPYSFDEKSGRAGVLTQISFLSLFSHPASSSPTKRGVALNEIFLCEATPTPPDNVNFSAVNGSSGTRLKTVRLRLEAHSKDETCSGCHSVTDPPGLALERFDSLGEYRETESGEPIDVHAELDGTKFEGATGLGKMLHENPRVPACLVRDLYASGVGRSVVHDDKPIVDGLARTFAAGGYQVPAFMKMLALSDVFYTAPLAPTPLRSATAEKAITRVSSPAIPKSQEGINEN